MTFLAPSNTISPIRREWLLVGFAIAIRLLLMALRPTDLVDDADAYLAHAQTLTEGNGYCVPGTDRPTAFRPPALPIALAALQQVGCTPRISVALLNIFSVAVLLIAVTSLCRSANLNRRITILAMLGLTLDPLLLRYSLMPMTEVPSAAALTLGFAWLLKPELQPRHCAAAGLVLALGALIRPTLLLSIAIALLIVVFRTSRTKQLRQSTVSLVIFASVLILPWAIRNAVHWNRFLPATTHGGYTMLLGNNDVFYQEVVLADEARLWDGESLQKWQLQIQADAAAAEVDMTNESHVDRWNQQQAVRTITNHRSTFVKAVWLRWKRLWGLVPQVESVPSVVKFGIGTWYGLLFPAAAMGTLLLWKTQRWLAVAICLNIAALMTLHAVYWANARMRTPLMPLLLLAAAVAVDQCLTTFRRKSPASE